MDIANLRGREKKGGATGGERRGRLAMQDVLKRVGSPVSLEAPRSARGVERHVISRGPSRGRSGCSQKLCRSVGGRDRGGSRGQGLRRSGDDKRREAGRSRGLLRSGDDKGRGVDRSRGLLGSGGDKRRGVGRSRGLLGSGGDKSRGVGRSRRLRGGMNGRRSPGVGTLL